MSPYTTEDWYLRSETPDDPDLFAFGLPQVWLGFQDDDENIWAKRVS